MKTANRVLGIHAIHSLYRLQTDRSSGDITLNELRVAAVVYLHITLSKESRNTVSGIAACLKMPRSTVSDALARLVARGSLSASKSPMDGRVTYYHFTEAALDWANRSLDKWMDGNFYRWQRWDEGAFETVDQLQRPKSPEIRPRKG